MITYIWKITTLKSYPEYMGQENVVFSIIAEYIGAKNKEGMEQTHPLINSYISNIHVTQDLILDNNTTFTPYAELTEEQVLGWLITALTPEKIEEMQEKIATEINAQIDAYNQLFYTQLPLPWSN